MSPHPGKPRETAHLWLATSILLSLVLYSLSVQFVDRVRGLFEPYTYLPVADWITYAIFLWLLALLLLAYRRWRDAIFRERELESIFASINPNVLLIVNPDRTIAMCNNAVRDMFGYEPGEVTHRTTDLLYFDRRVSGDTREVFNAIRNVGFHIGTATGRRKDGSTMPLEIITSGLIGRWGAVLIIRDITERTQREEAIIRAKEAAEQAEKTKTEILNELQRNYNRLRELEEMRDKLTHMIVHDLRSPATSIRRCLELLKADSATVLDAERLSYLDEAARLTGHLSDMINSLLDISRLENGQMPINRAPCDLARLCDEAVSALLSAFEEKRITIGGRPDPIIASCDRDLVLRVLLNLLGNSIKFTPSGGRIDIEVTRQGALARVQIRDTGRGIPPEYLGKVFERFFQVEARKYSSGLGLAFCKLAIEAHGGRIGVESEQGKGSTFWFTLPCEGSAP